MKEPALTDRKVRATKATEAAFKVGHGLSYHLHNDGSLAMCSATPPLGSRNGRPEKDNKGESSQSTTVPSHQSFTGNGEPVSLETPLWAQPVHYGDVPVIVYRQRRAEGQQG